MDGQGSRPSSVPRDATAPAMRRRRRPALACESCRTRKIKCDRKSPCNKCIRGKRAQSCTYVPEGVSATVKARPSHPNPTPARHPPTPQSPDGRVPQTVAPNNRTRIIDQGPLQDAVEKFGSNARSHGVGDTTSAQPNAATGLPPLPLPATESNVPLKETFVKGKLFGASHWTNSVDHLPNMLRFDKLAPNRYPQVRELMAKCKQYARQAKKYPSIFEATLSELRDKVPPRNIADRLFQSYLESFETVFRLHHIISFKHEYEEYWSDPTSAKDGFIVKLLLVLALGTCFDDHDSAESFYQASMQWVVAAHAWANSPYNKRRSSLVEVQIHCLLLLARQTHAAGGDMVWVSSGTLLRAAMQLGLHRDPSCLPVASPIEAEVRKRVWATAVELLAQTSIDAGQPPLISVDDFDCGPPSEVDDFDNQDHAVDAQMPVQKILLESLPVRLEIAKFLNHFRSDLSYSKALELSTRLTKSIHIPPVPPRPSSESQLFQRKMVGFLLHRFLIVLHQAFAAKVTGSPTFYFSRKMCADASLLVLNFNQPAPESTYFMKLMSLGNGIFHTSLLQAAACILLEQTLQQEEVSNIPSFVTQSSLISQQEQRQALHFYHDVLRERLKRGQSNFKAYILLSSAILQLDETQNPTESEKISHVEKLLQECTDILAQVSGQTEMTNGQQETPSQQTSDFGDFGFDMVSF